MDMPTKSRPRRVLLLLAITALVIAACSTDRSATATAAEPATPSAASSSSSTTEPATPSSSTTAISTPSTPEALAQADVAVELPDGETSSQQALLVDAEAKWAEAGVSNYSFELTEVCPTCGSTTHFVTVVDGTVETTTADGSPSDLPEWTAEAMFDAIQTGLNNDQEMFNQYGENGFPTFVSLDARLINSQGHTTFFTEEFTLLD